MLILTPHLLLKAFWNAIYSSSDFYMFSRGGEYGYYNRLSHLFPHLIYQSDYFPIVDNGKEMYTSDWRLSTYYSEDYIHDDEEILYSLYQEAINRVSFSNTLKIVWNTFENDDIISHPHMCTMDIRAP